MRQRRINRDLDPKPSFFKGIDLPVESITWNQADEFWFPFGEHRRPGYSVGLTCGGARRAARSSAMICCRHSMPSLVKAVTPSSPTP